MARFKDTRGEKKTLEERTLDKIEKLIKNFEDNCAGPYWTNRAQKRAIQKATGGFKRN